MAAGPGAAESTGIGSGRGGTGSAAPRRPSQPSLRGPHRGPSHPETRAQIHVSLSPPRGGRTGVGGAQRAGPRDPGTHGGRGRAPRRPRPRRPRAAPQPVLPAPDPDCDPRRPPPSAEACARQAATREPPGASPPPGAARQAPRGRRQLRGKVARGPGRAAGCSRASGRASPRGVPGGPRHPRPRPHLRSPTSRDALRPRVSRRLPACAPRSRPACRAAPPRLQPAPSPAGRPPASLVTREQLRPESPGLAGEGEASPPPGQATWPLPGKPEPDAGPQASRGPQRTEGPPRVAQRQRRGQVSKWPSADCHPHRECHESHAPPAPSRFDPRPHPRARGERCIGWGESKHFQKAPGFTSQQSPSILG